MSIFDDIPRNSMALPAGEAQFSYLNLSARPEAARVREKVDTWIAEYPEKNRNELVARFRSAIGDQHHSAFFELFLYHLLLARGCKVLEIEPTLPHTTKSPDFLAENGAQKRFYLEAVQASGLSSQDFAARARLSTALAAIDSTPSPLHFLDLTVSGSPAEPLSTKKLVTALKSWIASLPSDETAKDVPPFMWDEHGAKMELRGLTRNKPDEGGRAIGISRTPVMRIEPSREIRPALKKKASRYGKLDHPYLVALNALSTHHSEEAVIDALLGTSVVRFSKGPNGEEIVEELRQPDGIWYGPPDGQPQNTRLSGVLALKRIDPWNFCTKTGLFVPNPWAAKPLPKLGLGTAEFVLKGNQYERVEGQPMHALVGLPAAWPEA
jgi:hypothetical protein